jgi:hypothetical protein
MVSHRESDGPQRVIRCRVCEELLALVGRDGRVIIEADAETTVAGGGSVISCPCGARTIIPVDWEVDER